MSTDLGRVRDWLDSGLLLHPMQPAVPNTVDLARVVAQLNGAPRAASSRRTAEDALHVAIGTAAPNLLLVLLDGMGLNVLEKALPPSSFLRRHLAAQTMHAVFPATTTAALNSLASGTYPSTHGLPGWTVRLDKNITATPLPFVEDVTQIPLSSIGVAAAEVFTAPSLYDLYTREAHQISEYAGTAFSSYSTGGCAHTKIDAGSDSAAQAVAAVERRWQEFGGQASFTYWYSAEPDSLSHQHGWRSDAVARQLCSLDEALETLWSHTEGIPGGRTIIVTADHGHLEMDSEAGVLVLGQEPSDSELTSLLACPPTIEPRTPAFHVLPGQLERFATTFRRSRFGRAFALLSVIEIESLELFGPKPLGAACRERLGDFVAISPEEAVILWGTESPLRKVVGQHGGATAAEMRIPLVIATDQNKSTVIDSVGSHSIGRTSPRL